MTVSRSRPDSSCTCSPRRSILWDNWDTTLRPCVKPFHGIRTMIDEAMATSLRSSRFGPFITCCEALHHSEFVVFGDFRQTNYGYFRLPGSRGNPSSALADTTFLIIWYNSPAWTLARDIVRRWLSPFLSFPRVLFSVAPHSPFGKPAGI
ncbi:hypothetical protein LZ32DRAFT_375074 [Colletotrichum eremochloae]|nr:hypothetical protein LZ32DRAFT_375074 [Colletotrichum eremochloae]